MKGMKGDWRGMAMVILVLEMARKMHLEYLEYEMVKEKERILVVGKFVQNLG